jgi:hypothetical protein
MEGRGQYHASAALSPEKNPGGHWRLGGPQSQFGRFGEENNFLLLEGIRTRTVQPARLTDTFYPAYDKWSLTQLCGTECT